MSVLVVLDGIDLTVVAPRGRRATVRIPPHPTGRLANRQPAWSPDATKLAWSAFDRRRADAPTIVSVVDADGSGRVDHELVFPAFYLHWKPDGTAVAALCEGPLGIELTLIELADASQHIVARGSPLFFDWSPDGALAVHVGQGSDHRLEIVESNDGHRPVSTRPGRFTTPAWRGADAFVAATQDDDQRLLSLLGIGGEKRRDFAVLRGMARFALSPDGGRLAWVDTAEIPLGHPTLAGRPSPTSRPGVPLAVPDRLVVHDLDDERQHTVSDQAPVAFSWSPDGTKLLYCERLERGEPPLLQWFVWSAGGVQPLAMFRPSALLAREYLPFADQYARSRTWWSPGSDAFCFAGADLEGHDGVWVQPLDRRAERVSAGQLAFWAPR